MNGTNRVKLTPHTFAIEEGDSYAGFRAEPARFWNGWECPYFFRSEALNILRDIWQSRVGCEWSYDEKTDSFSVLFSDVDPAYNEPEVYPGITAIDHNGNLVRVYAIGAGYWIWDSAEEVE